LSVVETFSLDRTVSMIETALMSALREFRDTHGLTLEQLGEKLGVRKATIWKYENGVTIPADRVLEIERIIGIPRHALRPDLWPHDEAAA
jgi:DNA-binding XRE family transcriptional regulator